MKVLVILMFSFVFSVLFVLGIPIENTQKVMQRKVRGINWPLFSRTSTSAPTTSTVPPKKPNDLVIGDCEEDDKVRKTWRNFKHLINNFVFYLFIKLIYIDDTKLEANNSTLSGIIEIHIDSPYYITCTKIFDQMINGTGAVPSYNSGGTGHKFVFVNVEGQYGYGIHFKIFVRGNLKKTENEIKSNDA